MWEISKIISDFLEKISETFEKNSDFLEKISETFEKNSDILGVTLGLFLCNSSF